MKRFILGLFLFLAFGVSFANAQSVSSSICYTTDGRNCVPAIAANKSASIAVTSATTTQLVALLSGKSIYVTSFALVSTAANTAKFVYGTGSNCGTGTTDLTGAFGMSTFTVIPHGNGLGSVLYVPPSNALCVVTTTTGTINGLVSYTQF